MLIKLNLILSYKFQMTFIYFAMSSKYIVIVIACVSGVSIIR